jgi:hypothetical protein
MVAANIASLATSKRNYTKREVNFSNFMLPDRKNFVEFLKTLVMIQLDIDHNLLCSLPKFEK